jgi:hypothetical protein
MTAALLILAAALALCLWRVRRTPRRTFKTEAEWAAYEAGRE